MAEAVGLALAGVGLIGLFTTCLDVLEMVDVSSSFGRDITLMNQMFDSQRYRLLMWAQVCYSSPTKLVSGLELALARSQIENNLNCIVLLFQDESRLKNHFGLSRAQPVHGALRQGPNAVFQDSFAQFCESIRQVSVDHAIQPTQLDESIQKKQKEASLIQLVRWSVRDRKKFLELISFLKTFIDGLWEVADSIGLRGRERQQAETTIDALSHDDNLAVAAPAMIASDPLADAAVVQRLSRLDLANQRKPQLPTPTIELQQQTHDVISVLFVDYGNSCRSPMAEAIFKSKTAAHVKVGSVDSAGVGTDFWLQPTDQRTVFTLYQHQIEVPTRQPRKINPADFTSFDYMLAMDKHTLSTLERLRDELRSSAHLANIKLFGSFTGHADAEVKDPFFQGFDAFESCYDELVEFSDAFLNAVLSTQAQ
ncbi:hypothetical protein LTR84_006642 [Exophiala bonariae]|uniref:Phosphotyrosine protein phosphatase I domain-containing protein n=1 Tax=Exophiala bonariae TaxID=1690606 RepID=A0AAV9N0Z2_9EURO|nr:hypothetical protein LTR84_006642 [Exophiala bonariae]